MRARFFRLRRTFLTDKSGPPVPSEGVATPKTSLPPPLPPPPPPPPPHATAGRASAYFSSYKTILGKSKASLRYWLNRFQPWSPDHRFAVASWMAIGTTWWIVAGTSTFLSLVFWVVPSDEFQQFVARQASEYVGHHTGAQVTFGSAIQPSWRTLRLRDVEIVRTEETSGIKDCTALKLRIEQMDVKVSLLWLLEGKGLLEEVHLNGVSGTIDRRNSWNAYDSEGNLIPWQDVPFEPYDQRARAAPYRGSPHLRKVTVKDAQIALFQPEPTRPLHINLHHLESRRLRRQWLLYDLLGSTAEGQLDERLFSLRPVPSDDPKAPLQSRFHMDGVNVDIGQPGATGPLSWITEGRIDVNAIFYFPRITPETPSPGHVRMKVDLNLTHLTASVPLRDKHISYLNAALVQPMVVYLNTNYVSIPLSAWLDIPINHFYGAWSPYQACITDALSEAVGVELSRRVADQKRPRNLLWLFIKGVDGVWRAAKHSAYVMWHVYFLDMA